MLRNDVVEELLRVFLSYNPKTQDGSYVEGTLTSMARYNASMTIVVSCLIEEEKCEGPQQKKYTCVSRKKVKAVVSQIIGNVG